MKRKIKSFQNRVHRKKLPNVKRHFLKELVPARRSTTSFIAKTPRALRENNHLLEVEEVPHPLLGVHPALQLLRVGQLPPDEPRGVVGLRPLEPRAPRLLPRPLLLVYRGHHHLVVQVRPEVLGPSEAAGHLHVFLRLIQLKVKHSGCSSPVRNK